MKSYYMLALFAIVPFLIIDANAQSMDSTIDLPMVSDGVVFSYDVILDAIEHSKNGPVPLGPLQHANDGSPFHDVEVLPKCTHSLYQLAPMITMNDGDIVIDYEVPIRDVDINKLGNPILVFTHSNPQSASILTLDPELTDKGTVARPIYRLVVDSAIVDDLKAMDPEQKDRVDAFVYFYYPSNTVSNEFMFSNSSDGAYLFYYENAIRDDAPVFINLPSDHNADSFVPGTHQGLVGDVYLPTSDITFDNPIICRYAMIDPSVKLYNVGTSSDDSTSMKMDTMKSNDMISDDMSCIQCTPEEARMIAEANLLRDLPLSVQTDKVTYDHNSEIMISGQVSSVTFGAPVIVTVFNPLNSIVTIDQVDVAPDKTFETVLNTAGQLWKYDGLYIVKISYANSESNLRIVLTGGIPLPDRDQPVVEPPTPEPRVCADNEFTASGECIPYTITGGEITSAMIDTREISLVINIDTQEGGMLTISPSEKVQTGIFMVLIDGEEYQDATIDGNTVTIMFPPGAENIEVYSTWIIPEFGAIAMLILAVAIVSMIVISTRSRLGVIPRY